MLIALKLVFLSEKDEQMNHKWIFWVALVCLFTIPAAALGAVPKAQGSTHYFYLPFTPAVTQLFMLVSMDDQSPMNSSQMRMLMTDKAGSESSLLVFSSLPKARFPNAGPFFGSHGHFVFSFRDYSSLATATRSSGPLDPRVGGTG
jgi:hypothetical protein